MKKCKCDNLSLQKMRLRKMHSSTFTKHIIILISIIIFASFLRLHKLDRIPNGFFCDEAATGYDAYSILKTAKDSHARFLPLLMNHHNTDYVEPMYTYLTVPFVFLLDLNIFSTRLLAAVIGTMTILTTYLFAKELFNKKVALISAFLLAVSPWHLQFSRIAFRGILAPFFITLGLFFFLKAFKKPKFFIFCGLGFGFALYTYSVTKVCIPLILMTLFIIYFKKLTVLSRTKKQAVKYFSLSFLIFIVLAFPIYFLFFFGEGAIRFQRISIFAAPNPLKQFVVNLSKHLSPGFLFFHGDGNLRHSIPQVGQFLSILIPFLIVGLFGSIKKTKKECLLLVSLFLIGLIPSSLTNEGIPHALRSISALPFLQIIGAFGICLLHAYLNNKQKYINTMLTILVILFFLANIVFSLHAYFVKYPFISEDWFQFGLEEAIDYVERNSRNYDHIILTHRIHQGYIFPLFFAKIDPLQFQESGEIGKYAVCVRDIEECDNILKGRSLYIARPNELLNKKAKHYVYNYKGQIVFKIVE